MLAALQPAGTGCGAIVYVTTDHRRVRAGASVGGGDPDQSPPHQLGPAAACLNRCAPVLGPSLFWRGPGDGVGQFRKLSFAHGMCFGGGWTNQSIEIAVRWHASRAHYDLFGFLMFARASFLIDHRNDHRNVCVLASNRGGCALQMVWAVMAINPIKYFRRHAEVSRRFPDRHTALHQPRRCCVPECVWNDLAAFR
jgi:hypothetical protein